MKRSSERLIDAFVLLMMLVFAFLMREEQPALAGVIVMAALKFWMDKNASEPHVSIEDAQTLATAAAVEAAAIAAAKVLEVAQLAQVAADVLPVPPVPPSAIPAQSPAVPHTP